MKIAVHITHESARKIGGIGAVLSGVCNVREYKDFYDRTLFYGPLFELPTDTFSHLGKLGRLLYSSHDNYDSGSYADIFDPVAAKYDIDIVYGTRELVSEFDVSRHTTVDVINVGINRMKHDEVEKLKYALWKHYDIKSHLYSEDWDYEQYLRIAIPFLDILYALHGRDPEFFLFAHEYMGVPCALASLIARKNHTTVFVAHEVTTARSIVENRPGHDVSFYNILRKAGANKSLEQVYGSQEHNPRNELIKRAVNFDRIFAVSDHVRDEYLFLVPETQPEKISVVYNGVSAKTVDFDRKLRSRELLKNYLESLFNFTPDAIFTHVTRLVISKGIWRDIALLYALDDIFHQRNLKGAYILLSTLIATGRPPQDVYAMERDYGWPLLHRHGWPDLIGTEADTYDQIQVFNARSKAIKALFINQFGFDRTRCGTRIPQEVEFDDLRIASDAELGLSIYEPFGIAQVETIPFGGVSILSSSCGAAKLLEETFENAPIKPYHILDYVSAGKKLTYAALKDMTIQQRDHLEAEVLAQNADRIFEILPLTDDLRQEYLNYAHQYASHISWAESAPRYALLLTPST